MIIKLQKYYEDDPLSGAVSSVIFLDIRENCTLKEVHVSVGANVSGANAVFALKKNGVAITGAGVTINIGSDEAGVTGLSEALAEDDKLDLALVSGAIDQPVVLTLTVDDGVTIDDLLPDQSGNAGKVLETDGTNASWQTPSGGGAWTHITKPANESRVSTATLTADTELQFAVASGKNYNIRLRVMSFSSGSQMKWDINCPATGAFQLTGIYSHTSTNNLRHTAANTVITLPGSQVGMIILDIILLNTSASGTFSFRWSQSSSNPGNAVIVYGGSTLEYIEGTP